MMVNMDHRRRRGRAALAGLIALAAAACSKPSPDLLAVSGAWVRLPAVPGRPAAGYLSIAGGAAPDRLVAVSSSRASRAELHESMTGMGGMTGMRPLEGIDVAADRQLVLAPGGAHVMIFDVDPALKAGGAMPLTLTFRSGRALPVEARLVGAGDPAPADAAP